MKETWIDWLPDEGREDALLDAEPLLTRDELVAELKGTQDEVTVHNLVHWQSMGAIPYPVTRRRRGAPRALYPQWMINLIHTLRTLQEKGYKLREIGPILRDHTDNLFAPPQTPRQQEAHDRQNARRALAPLWDELDVRIKSLARVREQLHGGNITRAELKLIDDQDKGYTYLFLTGYTEWRDEQAIVDVPKNTC